MFKSPLKEMRITKYHGQKNPSRLLHLLGGLLQLLLFLNATETVPPSFDGVSSVFEFLSKLSETSNFSMILVDVCRYVWTSQIALQGLS